MQGYRFERLSENNLHNLVSLYQDCFHLKIDREFLLKKYNTRRFGAQFIGFLAFEEITNACAGYYGVFPMAAQLKGETILIAQSGDTMTHPNHQGKGLFTELAKATYLLAEKEGVNFVFGFPNKNSFPGFQKKLNWSFVNNVNNYVIKTGSLPFDKLFKKYALGRNLYRAFVRKRLRKWDANGCFMNSLEKKHQELGCIKHDDEFFQYKSYFESYLCKIGDHSCVLKVDGRLWIGDIEACSKEEFIYILNELVLIAKSIGCSTIQFSVTNNTFCDLYLKEKYTIKSINQIGYINLSNKVDPSVFVYTALDFDTY